MLERGTRVDNPGRLSDWEMDGEGTFGGWYIRKEYDTERRPGSRGHLEVSIGN